MLVKSLRLIYVIEPPIVLLWFWSTISFFRRKFNFWVSTWVEEDCIVYKKKIYQKLGKQVSPNKLYMQKQK